MGMVSFNLIGFLVISGFIGLIVAIIVLARRKKSGVKSIPCDNCGARIHTITNFCPECGEEIGTRMDPHVRDRIFKEMNKSSPVLLIVLLSFIGLFFIFMVISSLLFSVSGSGMVSAPTPVMVGGTIASVPLGSTGTGPPPVVAASDPALVDIKTALKILVNINRTNYRTNNEYLDVEDIKKLDTSGKFKKAIEKWVCIMMYTKRKKGFCLYVTLQQKADGSKPAPGADFSYYVDETGVIRTRYNPTHAPNAYGGETWKKLDK